MVIKEIKKRRSIRLYKSDPVSDEMIEEIIKAAQFAPTAHNARALDFIVIKDQKTKDEIFAVVGQEYVQQAPVLIVPVATSEVKLPIQDISVASGYIFLQAAALGLGTVWKNLMPEWILKVKEILDVPQNFQIINIIPLGYAGEEKGEHEENEFSQQKIHQEKW